MKNEEITLSPCSNRTFMELKLSLHRLIVVLEQSSNRTFMELKYAYKS